MSIFNFISFEYYYHDRSKMMEKNMNYKFTFLGVIPFYRRKISRTISRRRY